MAFFDRRNKNNVYLDGSSLIAVGLTEAQAQEALADATAVAGWYGIGYTAGGNVGRDNNAQKEYDESGEPIASTRTVNDFVITNTSQQTDAVTLGLFEWLESNDVPVRYILPTPDPDVIQLHYHPSVRKDEGSDQLSTQQGVRTLQFTLRGAKRDHVYGDLAADQSDWTEAFADATDDTFAAA